MSLLEAPVIEATGLTKTYQGGKVQAVRGIDLTVRAGVCLALLGPNGAGKSTTLEMLQGLLEPTSGSLKVFGLEYKSADRAIRSRVGGMLQETQFYGRTRVRELLELFASLYEAPLSVEDSAGALGLSEVLDRFVQDLSGGQRQRAFLATALIGEPELVFLDEPTTGLDPSARRDFWDVVKGLKARGRTVILSTHYMEEAEALADDLAIVDHGRIIERGAPNEIIDRVMRGRELPPAPPRRATLYDVFLTLTGHGLEEAAEELRGAA